VTGRPIWIALLAAAVLLVGSLQLTRPGYSVDEEFTVFAVRGIQATGLPLLPSGLLYDRGLAYSYASWLVSFLPGNDLIAARAVSLLSVTAALVLIFILLNRLFSSPRLSITATALAASSVPFWAAATTARFYGPFLLTYVAAFLCIQRRAWIALAVVAMFSRWTHELAFTSMAIPVLGFILDTTDRRERWINAGLAIGVGLLVAQLAMLSLHYAAPSSGDTMIRRFFVWQVVNLFERPPDRQFGIAFVVMIVGWLIAPRRAFLSVIALCFVAFIVAMSITREMHSQPLSKELVWAVLVSGSRYPLDMFWHVARANPVTMAVAMGLMIARLVRGEWPLAERAVHMLWLGWVLWFGVVESGITINYLLVPVSIMLVAIAVDLAAIVPMRLAVALVVLAIVGDQWRGEGTPAARLAAARPTIHAPGIDEIRNGLQATDRIACTDELGCLMLVGRIDVWLALDDYVRERFVVRQGDEAIVGVYTGVPAVLRPADLFSLKSVGPQPERTLIVDVFKEYPIGNSRTWLPRALEADGLQVLPLLETSQLRVLQISPAESVALTDYFK
jgi:hypothetical protein